LSAVREDFSRLRLLWRWRRRAAPPDGAPLTARELRVSSQNGEDGVLQAIFALIGVGSAWFVEFGASTGQEGNCVLLADRLRWSGLFAEADPDAYEGLAAKYAASERVVTRRELVSAENVEPLLASAGVPREFDLLSIDIDGNDYWVWQAIRAFRPRVVVIEYNASLPPAEQLVMPRDDRHAWDATDYFGASLGAYQALGAEKGYELVHTDSTGVNAFFVAGSEAARLPRAQTVPLHGPDYLGQGMRLPRDPAHRPFLDLERSELVDAERRAGGGTASSP
jgi:hypothetical protein